MSPEHRANRLDACTSPYLRQHADNPVAWRPWDAGALEEARERDVPIHLSIGYSSCHWCHVMAHESFEDPATAEVLNAGFVNIKVDREERPDLDRIYQIAHQILTRRTGGWPLTVFVDPHTLIPFFAGTYFPRTPRHGMPAFTDLLKRVSAAWAERREALDKQSEKVREIFDALHGQGAETPGLPDSQLLDQAREQLGGAYDAQDGGFGGAPKFPMPAAIRRLLRHWARAERLGRRDREALEMVMHTLTRMARGGIFDHLGGGFCRYATDRRWLVPHFEKMLYDNGALLGLYADACAVSSDGLFEQVVADTVGWLEREMTAPEGAFYAALDADSEGEEGRFYLWHREQVKKLLDDDEYLVFATLYGIDKPANFEGSWILHRRDAWRAVVERLDMAPERAEALLARARAKLFEAREQRERPGRDDKILVAWNGLVIGGLARAARVFDRPEWIELAQRAVDCIRDRMVVDGRLHAHLTAGQVGGRAFLEDHAQLLDGLLALLAVRWRDIDVRFAVELADALLAHYQDAEAGGFFQTADDAEQLFHRPKPAMDEALPGANGVAATALARLGHLLGRTAYLDAAAATLRWAAPQMGQAPQAHCALLDALEEELAPPEQVIIRGPEAERWARQAGSGYRPGRAVYALPSEIEPAPGATTPLLPEYLPEAETTTTTAWVCSAMKCSLPITSLDALTSELGGGKVVTLKR